MTTAPDWPPTPAIGSTRRRRGRWVIVGLATVGVVGVLAVRWFAPGTTPTIAVRVGTSTVDDSLARAPSQDRVRVRVLNASGIRGYARRATLAIRDRGFDVVEYDTEQGASRSETLIVSHTGHGAWADRLRRALGGGRIEARPDSLRYVDLTVFVGRDWQPPTETLRP